MTVDEIFNILRLNNQFFKVTFKRRTDSKNSSAKAGDLRTMLCRTNMHKYKKGIIQDAQRDDEDLINGVLTVWSVNDYNNYVNKGMNPTDAGYKAWRRIDLTSITECSIVPKKMLPPDIRKGVHLFKNQYRANNLINNFVE